MADLQQQWCHGVQDMEVIGGQLQSSFAELNRHVHLETIHVLLHLGGVRKGEGGGGVEGEGGGGGGGGRGREGRGGRNFKGREA